MIQRMMAPVLAAVCAVVASACSTAETAPTDVATAPVTLTTSATPMTTTSARPAKPAIQIRTQCGSLSSTWTPVDVPDGLPAVWQAETVPCSAFRNEAWLTNLEISAIRAAHGSAPDTLNELYLSCVKAAHPYAGPGGQLSDSDLTHIAGMLMLCPNHPQAAEIARRVDEHNADVAARAAGTLFDDGTYAVPGEVKPGTYAIEGSISDCYWQRTNASGGIIANDFVVGAKRVQVTIRSSDHSFVSRGCGTWRRVS